IIRLWNLKSSKFVRTIKGHSGAVTSLTISPNGKNIISGSEDNTVRVWDLSKGRPIYILKGHSGIVRSVAISLDGNLIVSEVTAPEWPLIVRTNLLLFKFHNLI
ncbi:unnamed protein product, partial [marine sediment metagenome]